MIKTETVKKILGTVWMLLSNKHLQDYEKNGFLLLENFYSIEEILEIGKWTNEVASKPEIPGEQMMYFEESLKNPSNVSLTE